MIKAVIKYRLHSHYRVKRYLEENDITLYDSTPCFLENDNMKTTILLKNEDYLYDVLADINKICTFGVKLIKTKKV